MIVRNGIWSTLRAKGKTALFTLLILLLTLSLSLGLGLWSYCVQTLEAMDETYTSIALVEYMGEDYPDPYAADQAARAAQQQLEGYGQVEGVELWETTQVGMALSQGYQRPDGTIPYEDKIVTAVFQLTPQYVQEPYMVKEDQLPEEYLIRNGAFCTVRVNGMEWKDIRYYYSPSDLYKGVYVVGYWDLMLVDEEQGITLDLSYLEEQGAVFDRIEGTGIDPATGETFTDVGLMGMRQRAVGYTAIIGENLYSYEGKSGVLIQVDPGETDFVAEKGKRYLIHGELVDSGNSNRAMVITPFYDGCEETPWVEFDSYDDPILSQGIFAEYAKKYEAGNNYIQVEASDRIEALEPFQQGTLYLLEGRFPQAGEGATCVITQDIAQQLQLQVGDPISLSMMQATEQDPFALEESGDSRSWTVVGIANQASGYEGRAWVSQGESLPEAPLFGYLLGRGVLDNTTAVETVEQLEAMAPDGVRITLYDQGYAAAAQPLQAMASTAQGVSFASLVGVLAVLCLFAFLFVGRQQQAVDVMVSLGTPKGKIRLWLLSGAAVVAGVAVLVGMVCAALSMQGMITAALQAAQGLYAADRRYSNGALGITREVALPQQVPLWPTLASGGVVLLTALVLCVVFVGQAQRKNTLRQGKTRVPRSGTSILGSGAPRFAWLSIRRGGWRSAVVPVVALVLSGFLGFLLVTAQGWTSQKEELYDNTVISGQFTSLNGRQYTDLRLIDPWKLYESGLLDSIQLYTSMTYWTPDEAPYFVDSTYGEDRRKAWEAQQPDMVFLNDLEVAPEFIYGQQPEVTWLEGWDESFLADTGYYHKRMQTPWPCVASVDWMERQGLTLGAEIEVNTSLLGYVPVRIVGSYATTGKSESMFLPLGYSCLPPWEAEEGESTIPWQDQWFYGCRFTLASAHDLEAFRDYLAQEGYTQPGVMDGNRLVVVVNDYAFTQTVEALGRYITLGQILFPVLFCLMGVLGFVVSWLMVNGRRMEFAIMRGLGASRRRVFGSFFLEQVGLCLTGCALSALLLTLWSGQPVVWLAAAGFAICYLVGCALAVRAVGRTNIFMLLTHAD